MPSARRRSPPRHSLTTVAIWVALLWTIEFSDLVLTYAYGVPPSSGSPGLPPHAPEWMGGGYLDVKYGLHSGDWWDLWAIFTAPLLHAGLGHLIANTGVLVVLFWLSLAAYGWMTWMAVLYATLIGGLAAWLLAPLGSITVGASGVIFGLLGFLLLNGLVRRGCLPFLIAAGVFLLYGGVLTGLVPGLVPRHVSWQMHLGGFIGGLLGSWHCRHERPDSA